LFLFGQDGSFDFFFFGEDKLEFFFPLPLPEVAITSFFFLFALQRIWPEGKLSYFFPTLKEISTLGFLI